MPDRKFIIEIGSWHGRSSRVIADNMPNGYILLCVDTWKGSVVEQDTNHASARMMDGDHAFDEFCRNMWDHIQLGRVIPIRMHGNHAAKLLLDMGVKADFVFIDGGHAKGETKADIESFLPLLKKGATISGHDYFHENGMWADVGLEVKAIFGGNIGQPEGTHIWYTDSVRGSQSVKAVASPSGNGDDGGFDSRPRIYDCFIFNNEHEILRRRLQELGDVVDRFVIVEATKTHSGKSKGLNLETSVQNWVKFAHKITYIVVDDLPEVEGTITDKSWARERHQRDAIMRGLTECRDNDIILVSDVDELVSPDAIQRFNGSEICSLEMQLCYYDENTVASEPWREAKILTYKKLKELTPCGARYQDVLVIPNAGKHLSYFGGVNAIQQKIQDTAHQEYNTDYFKNPDRIKCAIESGTDIFGREHITFKRDAVREPK